MEWDSAGSDVYVPIWRSEVAKLAPAFDAATIYTLPGVLRNLAEIGSRIPDAPGTLLTREQRAGRAAQVIVLALMLALIDHGWKLHFQPGEVYIESESGSKMNPRSVIEELSSGTRTADAWRQYCETDAIGDWPLVLP